MLKCFNIYFDGVFFSALTSKAKIVLNRIRLMIYSGICNHLQSSFTSNMSAVISD